MTTWEKIKDWWVWYGCELINFHRFRSFRRGLYNLFIWFSTIWYDRQWDDYYLYNMLRVKFRRMEQFYGSKWAMSADADKVAHQCKVCKILCERIIANDYTTPYDNILKQAEEKRDLHFEKLGKRFKSMDLLVRIQVIPKVALKVYAHQDMMFKQDIEVLCKMINKYSQCWWD